MAWDEEEDTTLWEVVINHEEQYSIWPADRVIPTGWKTVGPAGSRQEALDYIEEVWTDMRPVGLRERLEAQLRDQAKRADKR